MHILCPHCKNAIELVELRPREEISCAACGSSFHLETSSTTGYGGGALETLGRFELLGTLGQGAFGTVYKARDPKLDRVVAVKVPRRDNVGTSEQDRDRFLREARSAAQLRHPSIVAVHEVGAEGELTYLVSDFVDGVTLSDRLTAGRPSVRDAANIVAAVAEALQYAHSQGVVHRDVKPSNIMVRPDGTPVVMDFGLAKRDAGEITMTVDGQILGTPAYMSPEQARGEGHKVDGRSDVYSLGVILYQLLTGELPFRGNTRMLLHQVLHYEPKPPRSLNDRLPRDLETVCLKAMAKEPGRRYATAGELAADLRRWLGGEPILARPVGRVEHTWRWARRNPAAALAGAFGVLALAALAAAGVQLANSGRLATAYKAEFEAREAAEDARAGEEEQRKAAEVAEGKARDALKKMEQVEYFNNILIASAAAKEGRDRDVRETLVACRPELRGWEWYELQAACHREHLVVKGEVFAFCPTREEIACAEEDGTIRVWDLVSGREVGGAPLIAGGRVLVMRYSPNGRRLATAGWGGLRVWDVDGRRELWKADGIRTDVAFSPDGRWLAAAGAGVVGVWEADTGRELWKPIETGPTGTPFRVVFSPDGRRLVVSGGLAGLRVLEVDTGRELWKPATRPKLRSAGYDSAAFSPDGKLLAAGGWGEARVWEAHGGRELWKAEGTYFSVAFSTDGQRLAAGGSNGMRVWEAGTGRVLTDAEGDYKGVSYSPDGRRLAAAGGRGVRVWEAEGSREVWRSENGHDGVVFSPDGRRLAAQMLGKVCVWDAGGGRALWEAQGAYGASAFVSEGKQLALNEGRAVRVWEVDGGRELWKSDGRYRHVGYSLDGRRVAASGPQGGLQVWAVDTNRLLWEADGLYDLLVFSRDGKRLAARMRQSSLNAARVMTRNDEGLRVWEADEGRLLWEAHGSFTSSVSHSLEFSPDGRQLASVGSDGLRVWEADSGREVWKDKGGQHGLAFNPDGKWLATHGGGVRVWEAGGGRLLWKADGDGRRVLFSPDGRQLAAASDKDGLRVWEAATGRCLWLAGKDDGGSVYSDVSYSPDGKRIVTHGRIGLKVWDADGGREVWRFDGSYRLAAFSPDGRRLLVRGGNLVGTWVGMDIREQRGGLRMFGGPEDAKEIMAARRQAMHHLRSEHHRSLAYQAEEINQWPVALFHWEMLARAEPSQGEPRYRRGLALAQMGRSTEADGEFKAALDLRTTLPPLTAADCHARLGQFGEAAKLCQEEAAKPNATAETTQLSAVCSVAAGDAAGYRSACENLLKRLDKSTDVRGMNYAMYNVACYCALGPDSLPDMAPVLDMARRAAKSAPKSWVYRDTLGAVLYRAGKYAEAVAELEATIRMQGKGGVSQTHFFLAMAQHRLGQADAARKSLELGEKLQRQELPSSWTDKLERQLLLREAKALVRAKAKDAK